VEREDKRIWKRLKVLEKLAEIILATTIILFAISSLYFALTDFESAKKKPGQNVPKG